MDWRLWLAFVVASAIMGLIPGPGVTSIVGYALSSGRKTALSSVAGMALGNVTAMTVSLAGAGAVLAASALAFSLLKWLGAAYLIALGVVTIAKARGGGQTSAAREPISARSAFFGNLAVGTFHPKTIVFFVSFVPQFMNARGDYALQAMILVATFAAVVGFTDTLYALLASRASDLLASPKAALWSKRAGGGVLVAAGVATAAARS